MKHPNNVNDINNNTYDDTYNDTYDDTYDGKIRVLSNIRMTLRRLGNIVTNKDKKKIKKEIYKIEKKAKPFR